ncbi:aspartyl protease family protein At5g10770 [Eucalyptus grandis]|uniref:aspartyl protease family protein At5g10770 n=1 Tax=Eucalyptus grandis TaxID=71139 RepID=UPI00192EEE90|nr:aspartyl protease family protein At5g10770 [Eucalyptus grandis]
MASSLLSEFVRILLCAFVLSVRSSFEKKVLVYGAQITFPVCSLSPSINCAASTTNVNSALNLVHKHGPGSQLFDGGPINHTKVLLEDMARVKWIQSKISNSISGTSDLKESNVSLPASYGSGGSSYVVTVGLGTPTKNLTLLFDTGSALTWTQCEPCIGSCYNQTEPIFNPSRSSSYANISCSAPSCIQLPSGTDQLTGCSGSTCVYGASYGDASFTDGFFATETLTLTPTDVITNFEFGCGENNQGTFDGFAGLLGLARDPVSIIEQSATQYGRYFSYCLPRSTSCTGYLTFGRGTVTSASLNFTPMVTIAQNPLFYGINITGISVGGNPLSIPSTVFSNAGAIIDSGTTLTSLPPTAYTALQSAFQKAMANYTSAPPIYPFDTCYDFSMFSTITVPVITFSFDGPINVDLDWSGMFYWVNASEVCLAFVANNADTDGVIYGNTQQRTFEVIYDVPGGQIGFGAQGCS